MSDLEVGNGTWHITSSSHGSRYQIRGTLQRSPRMNICPSENHSPQSSQYCVERDNACRNLSRFYDSHELRRTKLVRYMVSFLPERAYHAFGSRPKLSDSVYLVKTSVPSSIGTSVVADRRCVDSRRLVLPLVVTTPQILSTERCDAVFPVIDAIDESSFAQF